MKTLLLFVILSIPAILYSRRNLFLPKSHGFYRFFSWECIIWLFAVNVDYWFKNPFSISQIISWVLLCISGYLVIAGVIKMKREGKAGSGRKDETLYEFEKTTELIDSGIFRYIRHPLYSSLLFLTWGIFFKHATMLLLLIALLSSVFLYITALIEEKECLEVFGEKYRGYMKHTRRFVPFLF